MAWAAGCGPVSPVCTAASDCRAPLTCHEGRCVGACLTTRDCAMGEVCIEGLCSIRTDGGLGPCSPDVDGDGLCGADDCDDGDRTVFLGALEVCTPSDGSRPRDESCDGVIDEGCDVHFGIAHAIVDVETAAVSSYWPRLSDDGLELCFANGRMQCARRPSTTERFGRPTEVASLMPGASITAVELSRDRLEAVVEALAADGTRGIFLARRTEVGAAFGAPSLLGSFLFHPALSPDALELIVQERPAGMPTRLTRAVRSSRGDSFGAFVPLDLSGTGDGAPFILPDGSLWFTRATGAVIANYAAARVGSGFGRVQMLPALDPEGTHVSYAQAFREAYFVSVGRDSTGSYTVFRARVCRDGPCPAEPSPCPSAIAGTPSVDGLHCYWAPSDAMSWMAASDGCHGGGGHLASIHGADENALVLATGGGERWIGLSRAAGASASFAWITAEPTSYLRWAAGEPNESASASAVVAITASGDWSDRSATDTLAPVCETERWPSW